MLADGQDLALSVELQYEKLNKSANMDENNNIQEELPVRIIKTFEFFALIYGCSGDH